MLHKIWCLFLSKNHMMFTEYAKKLQFMRKTAQENYF